MHIYIIQSSNLSLVLQLIIMLNLLLCLIAFTCFAFYCISAVLRDSLLVILIVLSL